jgi:RNA polymerase sigma-70 factor (ECF subfamily)
LATGDYDRLIRPIEDRMMRTVWHIVRDPDDADDAFQAALAKVWVNRGKIAGHANPHGLILRICINAAYDVLRQKAKQRRVAALQVLPPVRQDSSPSPSERLAVEEDHLMVLKAIGELPRNQAEAITLRCVEGLPYREIGDALGCSEVTARTHVARARERLCVMFPHLVRQGMKEATT